MSLKNTKILYFYIHRRSFIHTDLVHLEKIFDLTTFQFTSAPKYHVFLSFFRQFFYLLFNGWKYKYIVVFFAGYHSLLPALFAKLTGKKSIIFLAGTDCFKYPSFRYGNYTKFWYGLFSCMSARLASLLAPVSSNLVNSTSHYYTVDSIHQGIYHWCKNLKTPYRIIPFEYNPDLFNRKPVLRNENSFITIALGVHGPSFVRKGIDKTIMLAHAFPQCHFTIVGTAESDFPVTVPSNVTLFPPIPHDTIPELLSAHQFYLQLSIAEGFPSAVCEGMLCECIPIGSDVAAIPLIISSHGFIVKERNDEMIKDIVQMALSYPDKDGMGKAGRKYIIENFGPGKRIEQLVELFQ
ncbi:MAG TPA: glycosyltransferase family 4 protein [Saprospiraceae bacterium]|nr:glycosyltransferase family 4 protein [Saprospiraceae bacterium]